MNPEIRVVDILNENSRNERAAFEDYIVNLAASPTNDRLIGNYLDLNQKLDQYTSFTVMFEGDNVVGFSGLHGGIYPDGTYRALSRLFYDPSIREIALSGQNLPSYASRLMLPVQLEVARQRHARFCFLSFEGLNRRRFCFRLAEVLEDHYGQQWQVSDRLHNTARRLPDGSLNMNPDVWQNILFLRLNGDDELPLPAMEISDWISKYHSEEAETELN